MLSEPSDSLPTDTGRSKGKFAWHSNGKLWIGFLDACHTEALIIGHGQVLKKAQGRKPREKDAGTVPSKYRSRSCR